MAASSIHIAGRMGTIELSAIVQISERANRQKAEGKDILALSTGEPDFSTPGHVIAAAAEAMQRGLTRYPPTIGTLELRQAICRASQRDSAIDCVPSEVLVATGAKQVLFNAFFVSLEQADEVLIPAPYWSSYLDMVTLCGGKPVVMPTSAATGFKITPHDLRIHINRKTRWLMLNSPNNPSGTMYSRDELLALAQVLRDNPHVGIISDEIYQHISYEPFVSFRAIAPDLAQRMLIVNGVSKAYAMTGWRIGWGIGPASFIESMVAAQGQCTSGACSIAQAAAVAALMGPQDLLEERRAEFKRRRDLVAIELNRTGIIACPVPDGAFYVFPSCIAAFGKKTPAGTAINSDVDFCAYLLDVEGVAVVPGGAFGAPGHFRLSYAYSTETLHAALTRIARACAALQ